MTVEQLREAISQTYQCLQAAGITVQEVVSTTPWGTVNVAYEMRVPTSQDVDDMERIGDACIREHSYFVEGAYAMQPTSVEAKERHRNLVVRPGIESCLQRFGIVPETEPFDALWDQAFFARRDNGDSVVQGQTLRDCLDQYMEQAG